MNLLNFQSSKTLRESEGRTNRISFKIRKCSYASGWCFQFTTKAATTDSLGAPRGGRAPVPARTVPCAFAGCDHPFQGMCVSGYHGRVRGQTRWHRTMEPPTPTGTSLQDACNLSSSPNPMPSLICGARALQERGLQGVAGAQWIQEKQN